MNAMLQFAACAALLATSVVTGSAALAQAASAQPVEAIVKVVSSVDVAEQIDGKPAKATTFDLTFPPGASSLPHRHPGAVFGYVVQGDFEFKAGDDPVRTLTAGQSFYEPTMVLHEVGRNPSASVTTRVLAVIIHPRDTAQLVIPEPVKAAK